MHKIFKYSICRTYVQERVSHTPIRNALRRYWQRRCRQSVTAAHRCIQRRKHNLGQRVPARCIFRRAIFDGNTDEWMRKHRYFRLMREMYGGWLLWEKFDTKDRNVVHQECFRAEGKTACGDAVVLKRPEAIGNWQQRLFYNFILILY